MQQATIIQIASTLYDALQQRTSIEPLTKTYPQITLEDAYAIQQAMIKNMVATGAKVIGKKIGVTSKAVMSLLNVHQPDFGMLLDNMLYNEGQVIKADSLIQPKAEGEIAFLLNKDLAGPGITVADVLAATEGVMACFEIVDSRIQNWQIAIQDTVADNASCGAFVLGDNLVSPHKVDLNTCGMLLEKNGELVATGSGAAALGSPAYAVAWLANTLGVLGMSLKAGEIILSGSLATMVPVQAGDNLRVTIGGIGSCSVRFE